MDAAKASKVKWVRLDFNWLQIEPSNGTYDFTLFDSLVAAANARGLSILAVLAYTPAWASTGDTKADGPNNDVPIDGAYASFVTAVVDRYKSSITHYEMWNEPNLDQFYEGAPADYVSKILIPGADAVHAACATCKVVGPALATVGTEYATWLDAALTAAQPKIDVVSGHIYAPFVSEDSTAGLTADGFMNKLESHRIVTVGGVTVYEGPKSFREVMDAHGWTGPFWLTETGLEAASTDSAALTKQATRYTNTLEAMNTRPWWTNTIFYEAFDEPGASTTWGVCLHDTSSASGYDPKPAMSVLSGWTFTPGGTDGGVGTGADGGIGTGGGGTGGAASGGDGTGGSGDGTNGDTNGDTNGASGGTSGSSSGCNVASGGSESSRALVFVAGVAALSLRRRRRPRRPR